MIGHSRYYANELHTLYSILVFKRGSGMKDNQITKEHSIKEVTAKDKK